MKNLSLVMLLCLIAFAGCSQLKDENPTPVSNRVSVHPEGWASPSSSNFHGHALAANGWNMRECTKCHGADYKGGTAGVSCLTCHTKPGGPENCTTCHGSVNPAPPKDLSGNTSVTAHAVGMHQAHLSGGGFGAAVKCSECHNVPSSVYDPGHFDSAPPAEIRFDTSSIAKTVTNLPGSAFYYSGLPTVTPDPSYAQAAGKCSNTYCHGNFKNGNPTNVMTWTDTTSTAIACGTCHGDPTKATLAERAQPKTLANGGVHPSDIRCYACHIGIIDANMNLLDPSKHMNGKVNVFGTEQKF